MRKDVSEPFQNIVAQTMTGTSQIFSSISNILHKDSVGVQLDWTGSPTGSFEIKVSNNYKPALAQSEGFGAPNNGTWISLAIENPLTGIVATTFSTGLGSPIAINLNQLAFAWLQVVYTNASGTGVLTGNITAKSLG